MAKTTKIRQSAKGEDCTVRIPGCCNFNSETTVLAHENGAGMGMKAPDYMAAYCCSDCHDVIDGRKNTYFDELQIRVWFYQGVVRTQSLLIDKGLMVVK